MKILFTDGGCKGNHLPDAKKRLMTFVVTDQDGKVLVEKSESGGTNNLAELLAVLEALEWARAHGFKKIQILTDSRNNLAWIDGTGFVDTRVEEICRKISEIRKTIEMNLVWISRSENKREFTWSKSGSGQADFALAHDQRTRAIFALRWQAGYYALAQLWLSWA